VNDRGKSIADELGPPRWVWGAFLAIALAVLVSVAAFVVVRAQDNAVQLDRQDCARRINAEQAVTRDRASSTARAVSRYYFKAALDAAQSHLPVAQAQIDAFAGLVYQADQADTAVNNLPDLAKEVARRCPG
jgi:hypothetical protein